jgi:hypothetical protein
MGCDHDDALGRRPCARAELWRGRWIRRRAAVAAALAAMATATEVRAASPPAHADDAADDGAAMSAGTGAFVGARLAGDVGPGPLPAVGLTVAGGLVWERLRLEIDGTWWFERDVPLADQPTKGGTFSFVSGALAGCGVALQAPVEVGACGALEVGRIQAHAYGVVMPGEASTVWVAGRAAVNAAFSLTDAVWLRADAGVAVPVFRTAWMLRNAGTVDASPQVATRIALGPEIRF